MWAIYSVQIQRVSCHICLLGNKYFFETVLLEQKITKIYRLVNPTTLYQDPGIRKPNKILFYFICKLLANLLKFSVILFN